MSQQDEAYRAEYTEYSARRAAEGLPKVSYRKYLRQWKRSEDGHVGAGDPRIEKGGKRRSGWSYSPAPSRGRSCSPSEGEGWSNSPGSPTCPVLPASPSTKRVGGSKDPGKRWIPRVPDHIPTCGGSISEIDSGRLSVSSTRKLIEGLAGCQEPTEKLANSLLVSFLKTKRLPRRRLACQAGAGERVPRPVVQVPFQGAEQARPQR